MLRILRVLLCLLVLACWLIDFPCLSPCSFGLLSVLLGLISYVRAWLCRITRSVPLWADSPAVITIVWLETVSNVSILLRRVRVHISCWKFLLMEKVSLANMQKLEGAAAALVRRLTGRLYQQNWANIDKQNLPWETDLVKLKLRFYSFDGCYLNYLADVIETEFPGTVSLSLIKEAASKTEFMLMTTAKTQFLSKWLRTLLIEEGFLQEENYTLKSKQRFIDIRLHPNSSLAGSYC